MAPRFIARQLSHPAGFLGRIIGYLMNRHNAGMNAFAMRLLTPAPSDRVLEIGFGGGVNLPALVASGAFVTGVDRSALVVDRANAKYADAVAAGRAVFREGAVEALPFAGAAFGKVLTVNTIYFWRSLDQGLGEIRRVLAPGGRAVIGFLPKDRMDRLGLPADIFTTRAPDEVLEALVRAGFADGRIERPKPTTPWNVITARGGSVPDGLRDSIDLDDMFAGPLLRAPLPECRPVYEGGRP